MRDELTNKLIAQFPNTLRLTYITCGDGWYDLIAHLCMKIGMLPYKCFGFDVALPAITVIASSGGLFIRYNSNGWDISNEINTERKRSLTVCEVCGKPGKPLDTQCLVRCEEHKDTEVANPLADYYITLDTSRTGHYYTVYDEVGRAETTTGGM